MDIFVQKESCFKALPFTWNRQGDKKRIREAAHLLTRLQESVWSACGSVDFSKREGTHKKIKTVKSVSFPNETTFHLFKKPVMDGIWENKKKPSFHQTPQWLT